jgi:hypothetical protein
MSIYVAECMLVRFLYQFFEVPDGLRPSDVDREDIAGGIARDKAVKSVAGLHLILRTRVIGRAVTTAQQARTTEAADA